MDERDIKIKERGARRSREQLVTSLPPAHAAMFRFLEFARQFELLTDGNDERGGEMASFGWFVRFNSFSSGSGTKEVLERALSDGHLPPETVPSRLDDPVASMNPPVFSYKLVPGGEHLDGVEAVERSVYQVELLGSDQCLFFYHETAVDGAPLSRIRDLLEEAFSEDEFPVVCCDVVLGSGEVSCVYRNPVSKRGVGDGLLLELKLFLQRRRSHSIELEDRATNDMARDFAIAETKHAEAVKREEKEKVARERSERIRKEATKRAKERMLGWGDGKVFHDICGVSVEEGERRLSEERWLLEKCRAEVIREEDPTAPEAKWLESVEILEGMWKSGGEEVSFEAWFARRKGLDVSFDASGQVLWEYHPFWKASLDIELEEMAGKGKING